MTVPELIAAFHRAWPPPSRALPKDDTVNALIEKVAYGEARDEALSDLLGTVAAACAYPDHDMSADLQATARRLEHDAREALSEVMDSRGQS